MANTLNLDDIRAAVEDKYESTDITYAVGKVCKLLNPLRLPKEKRAALSALQGKLEDKDTDQVEVLQEVIRLVAEHKTHGEALIKAVGDDLAMLSEIFESYGKAAKVGEASASPA